MYTSGWLEVDARSDWFGGAERLPWLGVLVELGSGVAVLLNGTVEPGLLGTVTPGGGIGWRWLLMARLASEAPEALRCMAFVIMEVA